MNGHPSARSARPEPPAAILAATLLMSTVLSHRSADAAAPDYPESRRGDTVDELHGEQVPDPYRWLEEIDGEETRRWVDAQADLAEAFLAAIPQRGAIRARLEQLWNYERLSAPMKRGGNVFFFRNSGLQNQSVLYWRQDEPGAREQVLLDPNTLSEDGTVALSGIEPSDDGRLLAYGLSASGSDWQEWRVREVATGEDLPDLVRWVKFSGAAWAPDGSGFLYSRFDAPEEGEAFKEANRDQKVCFHRLGTSQEDDELVYARPDHPEWNFNGFFSEDGRFLVLSVRQSAGGNNALFYRDREADGDAADRFVELFPDFDARYSFLGNDGTVFYLRTDRDAPNGRVLAVDVADPAPERWREIVPESENALQSADLFGDRLVAEYLEDAASRVRLFGLDASELGAVELPGIGSVGGFGGRRDHEETFFTFTSFATPTRVYRFTPATGTVELFWEPEVGFDPGDFEVRREFVARADGTRLPVFLCRKKGGPEGPRPVYQYGYGGFNISMTPRFSVANLVWMEMGGVYAQVILRGGGEYGESWHQAGMLGNKQNVFDDFIAASEWLVEHGITAPEKLAIGGGSNGGLLVGACLVQRPDLFGACLPAVGVMDMLRFHEFTIGWAWKGEYGDPAEAEAFRWLRAYSPYHNLEPGTDYPATLVTTGDHDDRVFPAHSFKFAAALQHAQAGSEPVLIRIDRKAGHGAGKPTAKIIDEAADRWAFVVHALGMEGLGEGELKSRVE